MAKKKGEIVGFLRGLNFSARLNEAAVLSLVLKVKEEKLYEAEGYDTFKDFCKDALRVSYETINNRLNAMAAFGPEITSTLVDLGFKWRDVRMIDHVLNDDQKSNLKKGVLEIEGKKIQVNEDNADLLKSTIDNIIERAALARKAEQVAEKKVKHIQSKLNGLGEEHEKEIAALQSLIPDDNDTEWAEKFIAEIEKRAEAFDHALRIFTFRKDLYQHPELQAKMLGLNKAIHTRFLQFERDFEANILEGAEA